MMKRASCCAREEESDGEYFTAYGISLNHIALFALVVGSFIDLTSIKHDVLHILSFTKSSCEKEFEVRITDSNAQSYGFFSNASKKDEAELDSSLFAERFRLLSELFL